jgi:hypothetical protein
MSILQAALICFLVSFLLSCSTHGHVPPDVIGMNEMSGILLDMQMAQAYNDSYTPGTAPGTVPGTENRDARLRKFYAQILLLHHTGTEKFLKSYHFYEHHPDLMLQLYGIMQKKIDRKSAHEDSLQQARERILHPNLPVPKMKNFMFRFRSFRDSLNPPGRIFRPAGWVRLPELPQLDPEKFLLLYKTVADSIHHQPRRVFNPDFFD